jgi:hypothetical protein
MKVRVVRQPSGLYNGEPWPAAGEEMDLPQSVAEPMAETGDVEIVVETRPAPKGEERADAASADEELEQPKPSMALSKDELVEQARAAGVEDPESKTKAELVEALAAE